MAPHESILGEPKEPFAIRTTLGWTLCGGNPELLPPCHTVYLTELLEFKDADDKRKISQNDLRFLTILEEGLEQSNDGTITLPLPFNNEPFMPNNKVQAERRLLHLVKRFKNDSALRKEYYSFMDDVIRNGHAELVEKEPTTKL